MSQLGNKPETSPARDAKGQLLPGSTANKAGRPKTSAETKEALRAMLPRALKRLHKLLRSADERVAVAAIQIVLARNLGKEMALLDADEVSDVPDMSQEQARAIVEARKNGARGTRKH